MTANPLSKSPCTTLVTNRQRAVAAALASDSESLVKYIDLNCPASRSNLSQQLQSASLSNLVSHEMKDTRDVRSMSG